LRAAITFGNLLDKALYSFSSFLHLKRIHPFLILFQAEETPLHIAARIKDGDKVAEMLIKSGADVNAPSDVSLATC